MRLAGLNKFRIDNTQVGSGNATNPDLLLNKTANSDAGDLVGTMPNKVGSATVLTPSGSDQAVPKGYYGGAVGDGKVAAVVVPTAKVLNDTVIAGQQGTMPNNGSVGTVNLTTEGAEYTIQSGYHNGSGKVKATISGLVPNVLKSGSEVGGVLGTLEVSKGFYDSNIVPWSLSSTDHNDSTIMDCCYGSGKLMAITVNGKVLTSTNGRIWALIGQLASSYTWHSITYGNGLFVILDHDGNGIQIITGDESSSTFYGGGHSYQSKIVYGKGLFVRLGEDGSGGYSSDGHTWNSTNGIVGLPQEGVVLAYGNEMFVGISKLSNYSVKCTDPKSSNAWATYNTFPFSGGASDITYGNGLFVATSSSSSNQYATSTDGVNWTTRSLPSSGTWIVEYGDGKFVAVKSGTNESAYSSDGILWYTLTMSISDSWSMVSHINGLFVSLPTTTNNVCTMKFEKQLVTTNKVPKMSLIGDDSKTSYPDSSSWTMACSDNGLVVIVPTGSTLYSIKYSDDECTTWSNTNLSGVQFSDVAYGSGVFMALTSSKNQVYYSTDGITWNTTPINLPTTAGPMISAVNDHFIIHGNVSTIMYTDTSYTSWNSTTAFPMYSVTYGRKMYIASAYTSSNVYYYSYDLINWYQSTYPISGSMYSPIGYGEGKYVTMISDASYNWSVLSSIDGINWIIETTNGPRGDSRTCITYGNGLFVSGDDIAWTHYAQVSDLRNWTSIRNNSLEVLLDIFYYNGKFLGQPWDWNPSLFSTNVSLDE